MDLKQYNMFNSKYFLAYEKVGLMLNFKYITFVNNGFNTTKTNTKNIMSIIQIILNSVINICEIIFPIYL